MKERVLGCLISSEDLRIHVWAIDYIDVGLQLLGAMSDLSPKRILAVKCSVPSCLPTIEVAPQFRGTARARRILTLEARCYLHNGLLFLGPYIMSMR